MAVIGGIFNIANKYKYIRYDDIHKEKLIH